MAASRAASGGADEAMLTPSPPVSSVEMSAAGPSGRSTVVVVLLTSAATSCSPRSLVPEPSSEHAASSTAAPTVALKPHDLRRPRTAGGLPDRKGVVEGKSGAGRLAPGG